MPLTSGEAAPAPGRLRRVLRLPDLIFKREVGMTFERYLMTARVERSKRALLDPLNTVAAVAEQIGFTDPTYYAKVFRKITGCSPTEYRENPALYPIRNVSLRVS